MIKLLCLDCDGVLTNGKKNYNSSGICISKEFCDKDWTAIKRFRAVGVDVVILTGDAWNTWIEQKRNISVLVTRNICKSEFIKELCEERNISLDECAFVGDDLFDIEAMKICGYKFCPYDAVTDVLEVDDIIVLLKTGGNNVIAELFNYCEIAELIPNYSLSKVMKGIEELDRKEVF